MVLTGEESVNALLLCGLDWFISYVYYQFMTPIPVMPRYPALYSLPFAIFIVTLGAPYTPFNPLGVAIGGILGQLFWAILIQPFVIPARNQPGPFLAKFTRLWRFWYFSKGSFHLTNQQLHKKYGPIVRYGPNYFSIDDPESIKTIVGPGTKFTKSLFYYPAGDPDPRNANLFSCMDRADHAEKRRKLSPAFSMSAIIQMESMVEESSKLLENHLLRFTKTGELLNFTHWTFCYAFDVIAQLTIGARFGFLDEGKDVNGLIELIRQIFNVFFLTAVFPELFRPLFWLFEKPGKEGKGIPYMKSFCMKHFHARLDDIKNGNAVSEDQISYFVRKHMEDPAKMTAADIYINSSGSFLAASDTTAATLSAIIYYLYKYPRTFNILRKEIDDFNVAGRLSDSITYHEAIELQYLQVVIKEALRIHPIFSGPMERTVPAGGATVAGVHFPEGTNLSLNAWVVHFNTSVWGADADVFRPERWLEASGPELAKMNDSFLGWGAGSRVCFGKHIAMLEIEKLVPQLLRKYDFEICLPGGKTEWTCWTNTLVIPQDFFVKVRLRGEKESVHVEKNG